MSTHRRGVALALLALTSGCVTAKDAVGGGDSRIDEAATKDALTQSSSGRACGPDAPGDLVLLDARTGGPVTCLPVTITQEAMSCAAGTECQSGVVFKGLTSPKGQLKLLSRPEKARLVAVADGFAPSTLAGATGVDGRVLELELAPAEGFWLKALDAEGNYLVDVVLTFKQGDDAIAQLRTNNLANVFFTQRQPFAGQPVTVEAEGYQPLSIADAAGLGDDGHTLTLQRR